ncbi:chloramphenicol phosphotransferase [Streptomyces sp. NPDC006435]|uniref:phosphotransferase-like protein n=1 Tax=Streptomyces sp. NPDC006435 TaxID=3154300 RepID=UPI0033A87879
MSTETRDSCMDGKPPLCVVITGPSAAGKSTLAAAIQEHAREPLLRFGVDELYRMVPGQWAGGVANARFAERGFTYQDVPSMPGARRIDNGVDAVAMLLAMNAGIVGILGAGVGVIVDGQAFEPVVNTDLEGRLQDLRARGLARVAFIELSVTDEPLADRQRRHAHPVGLSRHQNSLPKQATKPDLVVETSGMPAAEVASFVCRWLEEEYLEA